MKFLFLLVIIAVVLSACGSSAEPLSTQPSPARPKDTAVSAASPSRTPKPISSATPLPTATSLPTATDTLIPLPTLPAAKTMDEVEQIELSVIDQIKAEGAGRRFFIDDPILKGDQNLAIGGLVFSEGEGDEVKIMTEFPGDVMPLPNVYGQKIWRFRGRVPLSLQSETGETYQYVFTGEGDDLNLLTFGRFPNIGFVYLRGKGTVTLLDGTVVKLGYE